MTWKFYDLEILSGSGRQNNCGLEENLVKERMVGTGFSVISMYHLADFLIPVMARLCTHPDFVIHGVWRKALEFVFLTCSQEDYHFEVYTGQHQLWQIVR